MCGIVTAIAHDEPALLKLVDEMLHLISHRGPDGHGVAGFSYDGGCVAPTTGADACVVLGNRRLAILDTSSAGLQPMTYRDRFWITYNGEIYNYVEVRADLEALGHTFRSGSDTE